MVAINGQPLSAQANQAELDRLNTLANHPEIQGRLLVDEVAEHGRKDHGMQAIPAEVAAKLKAAIHEE